MVRREWGMAMALGGKTCTGSRLALGVTLAGAVLAQACQSTTESTGPTPIERLLARDSSFEATAGDSSYRHIGFDYENLNRAAWQKPGLVLDRLGVASGATVAEIGSGTGFFTRRLAARGLRVLALDIASDMLIALDSINAAELDSAAYARIEPRLVSAGDPSLAPAEADAALVVNTYMYIEDGPKYLRLLAAGLKPGAPILVVDFKTASTPVGPPVASRVPAADVEAALRAAGFTAVETDERSLDYQYLVRARRG